MASLTGSTTAVFFVRLSTAVDEIVDVDWNTRDGTAIAGQDYEAASGTVSFLPGETEKAIDVIVYGQDDVSANGKKFYIELKPPANAVLTDALAECVITVADEDGVLVTSLVIAQGKRGLKGNPGLSAYEQAVLMGYEGTVEQWMEKEANAARAAERAEGFASAAASAATAANIAGRVYPTASAGVAAVSEGEYFNVRSPSDDQYLIEYQKIGGSAVATGKSYLSALGVQQQEKPAITIKDASGKSQQQLTSFKPNLLNDTTALPNTDVTAIFNAWTKNADDNQVPTLEIPMNGLNYTLTDTVVIQEPLAIVGDKGATYDRGRGKKGWLLLGQGLTRAFDLGNYRTYQQGVYNRDAKISPNQADNWTVKNIGIKPAEGVTHRTQDGLVFTNQTNGPDRAAYISEVSLRRLDKAIKVEPQQGSAIVSICSLNVNDSVICDSNYGIYVDGRSFQTSIENNQIEQNYEASIWGRFDGPFRAVNNVIEGGSQKSGIVFRNALEGGNNSSVHAILESHYFEALKDSCFDIEARNGSAFWIRGNRNYNVLTKDYCIVRKGSRTTIYNEEFERITLEDDGSLNGGSELTRNPDYSFYFRPTSATFANSIVSHDVGKLRSPTSDYTEFRASFTQDVVKVKDQLAYAMGTEGTFGSAAVNINAGDILEFNVLTYCETTGNGVPMSISSGGTTVAIFSPPISAGKWVSSTVITRALTSATNIAITPLLNATTATGAKIAAITFRNLGAYAEGSKYLARPVQPRLHTIAGKHAQRYDYAGGTVSANGGVRKFDLVLSQYGEVGDLVQAALSVYVADLGVSAVVRAGGVVQVTLRNPTTADIVVPACKVRVIVL